MLTLIVAPEACSHFRHLNTAITWMLMATKTGMSQLEMNFLYFMIIRLQLAALVVDIIGLQQK
ncbi:hypothetical protein A3734_18535 [Sulfitobacter sp. HI0054]|nr:hypothetical protein A3734_21215 [Sulfitobacter sp. HI0054]KZY52581.1 hypothetical protein A3734_18535 [Sulfitobacter sp. HI0054]